MIEDQINQLFEGGKVIDDVDQIKNVLREMQEYYITYAKFRMDLYF